MIGLMTILTTLSIRDFDLEIFEIRFGSYQFVLFLVEIHNIVIFSKIKSS